MVQFEKLKGVIARKVLLGDPAGLGASVTSSLTVGSGEEVSSAGFVRLVRGDVEAVNAYFVAEEARIARLERESERARRLRSLKRYAAVNYVGARKIAKKFDKNAAALGESTECRRLVEELLSTQRFALALRGDEELFTELEASNYVPSAAQSPRQPRAASSLGTINESLAGIAEEDDDEAGPEPSSFSPEFWATYATYGFVYSCRRALAVAKEPLEGALSTSFLSSLDSVLLVSYVSVQLVVANAGDAIRARCRAEALVPAAVLAAAAATFLTGLAAPGAPRLVATAWAANGAAQALVYPFVCVVLAKQIPPARRGRVMGAWNTCAATGGVISAALSAAALKRRGMRGAFEAPALATALCGLALVALFFRPAASPPGAARNGQAQETQKTRPRQASLDSSSRIAVWRMKRVPAVCAAYSLVKPIRYLFLFWHNYYLVAVLGRPLATAAAVEAVETLAALAGGLLLGLASDRCSPFVLFALCLPALALALLAFRPLSALSLPADVAIVALVAALVGAVDNLASGLTAANLVELNERDRGASASIASVVSFLSAAGTIGTILHSRLLAALVATHRWFAVFALAAAQAAVAAALLAPMLLEDLRAHHRKRTRDNHPRQDDDHRPKQD